MSIARRLNKENMVHNYGILVTREKNEITISTGEVDRTGKHCKVRQILYAFYMKSVYAHVSTRTHAHMEIITLGRWL